MMEIQRLWLDLEVVEEAVRLDRPMGVNGG